VETQQKPVVTSSPAPVLQKRSLPMRQAKENTQNNANQLQWLFGSKTMPVMNVLNVEELEDIDK